jgi:hypothetical protein
VTQAARLPATDQRQKVVRLELLVIDPHVAQSGPRKALLIAAVTDRKLLRIAEAVGVAPQDAHAERVQGRHLGARRTPPRLQQLGRARQHLARRLVSEGDGQDAFRRGTVIDEFADPVCDDARLSGARPGENQDGAFEGSYRLELVWVQRHGSRFFSDRGSRRQASGNGLGK